MARFLSKPRRSLDPVSQTGHVFPGRTSFLGVSCSIICRLEGEVGEVGSDRMDGRRLGGPVDWKTLAPGREAARGSISSGANMAPASLER